MADLVAFLSFRFGPTDGVSVVARTWMDAFRSFGTEVVTVTGAPDTDGAGPPDRLVEGLGLHDDRASPEVRDDLERALADVDLVVVENLLTIPANLEASRAAAAVLAGRPALLHHHDPPWHRERYAHVTELPASDPAWRHVAINHVLAGELGERGIVATVIHNAFARPTPRSADELGALRSDVRTAVGLDDGARVVAHPVRAIERKNLPAAIALSEALGATYWLLGPAEEGYGPTLEHLLDRARCPVVHHPWPDADGIYAAADHIAFPSTWEGFGNPPIEAALRRRTVSVGPYPVAAELRRLGFRWFAPGDVEAIEHTLTHPEDPDLLEMLDTNERIARTSFSIDGMRASIRAVLDEAGWCT